MLSRGADPYFEFNGRVPPEVQRQAGFDYMNMLAVEKQEQERAAALTQAQQKLDQSHFIETERVRLEDERNRLDAERVNIEKARTVIDAIERIGGNPELREHFGPLLQELGNRLLAVGPVEGAAPALRLLPTIPSTAEKK